MLGAIAGDVIGSVFEGYPTKSCDFPLIDAHSTFTDDTVLTVAVADAILSGGDYASSLKHWARKYPNAGYGSAFYHWMLSPDRAPYNSWGNGSAMRVSPVGFAFDSLEVVLQEAKRTAEVTHNHPEGIKGAQATAVAVFLARQGESKGRIRDEIAQRFAYDLDRTLDAIRPGYRFDISCQGSVPESIIAFLESEDVESAIRKAISLGGDSDTMACIAGAIAEAFYREIPSSIRSGVRDRLTADLLAVVDEFQARHCR
ncbi:MAG: ADP-ribosylglycohydrolase family protein [Gemmatimonadales bacterium]|nr:ADP-ribosylglycohydrolase family protein [Gemmatimonadales bacterium]NIN13218.1 ADP-ribosylglycohydrolase family protein [Gemmatimonadales bacterium]NIN51235.1 ADP-ribosylglycohydrolase family protein [Gemmatimonadales bacterium]NIP08699.1 ADP-ribosylglycohydrolase family protein [Gemmatimonadales bacterium]NIR00952.1 ADP-ribosylglycohydrolase family protein [Gemmatimonadales bacterium]